MAQKKRPRNRWLTRALFYIFVPLTIWALAFTVWFFWPDLRRLAGKDDGRTSTTQKAHVGSVKGERAQPPPPNRPREKILDEDREKLEDILKRK